MPVLHIQIRLGPSKLCRNLCSFKGLNSKGSFVKQRMPCVSRTLYTDSLSGLFFESSLCLYYPPTYLTHEHLPFDVRTSSVNACHSTSTFWKYVFEKRCHSTSTFWKYVFEKRCHSRSTVWKYVFEKRTVLQTAGRYPFTFLR